MSFSFEKLASPAYFAENRLPVYSDHAWYPDLPSADAGKNPNQLCLNGDWHFCYAEQEGQVPLHFESPAYDCRGWEYIHVPGHIQLQSPGHTYGSGLPEKSYDRPQYVNQQFPWDGQQDLKPGELPTAFNPVGCYVRYVTLPEHFAGRRTFLKFLGVESCAAVWLNGNYVGYSGNSFSPCEFELTPYLQPGENKLAVRVYKWNCGSWLEDQDFFRFSGIYRDVLLYAVPACHLQDLKVLAEPDAALQNGTVRLSGRLLTGETCGKPTAEVWLDGKKMDAADINMGADGMLTAALEVPDIALWSAEQPNLYTLGLRLFSEDGDLQEVVRQRIGFRRFELQDGVMKLNGRRIVFRGVNRHDFSPEVGRAVTPAHIRRDLCTMKRNNINAVRCSHYPNHPALYALCDELGLYVVAENNMETHGTWDNQENPLPAALPGDRKEWEPMLLDRIDALYENLKNHPSILIWSVGNESFGGSVIRDMAQELHRLDDTRPVHYEGVFRDRRYSAESTDMESQMYTPAEGIRRYLQKHRERPFISCEFSHSMGNSNGGLDRYTALTEEDPLYQGGFIWDFLDQSILGKDRYGKLAYFYGGDLDDRPNDGNFSGDGICFGDGSETPKMAEVRADYQPFVLTVTQHAVTIRNRLLFTGSDAYDCRVSLARDGAVLQTAMLDTAVPPESEGTVPLPITADGKPGEYCITVSFHEKEATPWAPAGHEVAFGQYIWCIEEETAAPEKPGSLQVIQTPYNIGVHGERFDLLFSRLSCGLVSYRFAGRELIKRMPVPDFWRPMTDNDLAGGVQIRCAQWRLANEYVSHRRPGKGYANKEYNPEITENPEDGTVSLHFTYYMPTEPLTACTVTWRVEPMGRVDCTMQLQLPEDGSLPPMPEFGMRFTMDARFDNFRWYGNGPEDSYTDRKNGVRLGIWESTVEQQFVPYLRPQECGNHTSVRWARVTDRDGFGLEFRSAPGSTMELSALPWNASEIEETDHPYALPPIHNTCVRCLWRQMGVGGDDTWGSIPHPEYWLPEPGKNEGDYCFRFSFRGCGPEQA